jgi:hypothetical protein
MIAEYSMVVRSLDELRRAVNEMVSLEQGKLPAIWAFQPESFAGKIGFPRKTKVRDVEVH